MSVKRVRSNFANLCIKLFFENFMLWSLSCRISNYGDYGPLRYGLSCCGSHCSGFFTFIRFHLNILWPKELRSRREPASLVYYSGLSTKQVLSYCVAQYWTGPRRTDLRTSAHFFGSVPTAQRWLETLDYIYSDSHRNIPYFCFLEKSRQRMGLNFYAWYFSPFLWELYLPL